MLCCEANGCEDGHGGSEWGSQFCPGTSDFCGCCNEGGSPIIVSLLGRDVSLSSASEGVLFDFWGNGQPRRYAWPTNPDDAWLVRDLNGNGDIDDAGEMFGNATRLSTGLRANHGYEVLAELDDNNDGLIDRDDPVFGELRVWRDIVRNGRVDSPAELSRLPDAGIRALHTRYHESRRVDQFGNSFRYRSSASFSRVPLVRPTFDVFITVSADTQ